MEFYYPNWNNDMWRITGFLFFNDKDYFVDKTKKAFCKERLISFLQEKGIALFDTASAIRRLQDNASDKFLEVVQPLSLIHICTPCGVSSLTVRIGNSQQVMKYCAFFKMCIRDRHLHNLIKKLGGIDLFFLSSGVGHQNRDLQPDIELNTARTNVEGFTRMVTAAFNYFKEKGSGHIAVISSIAGTKGLGVAPAYSATKRFQNTYILSLIHISTYSGIYHRRRAPYLRRRIF